MKCVMVREVKIETGEEVKCANDTWVRSCCPDCFERMLAAGESREELERNYPRLPPPGPPDPPRPKTKFYA